MDVAELSKIVLVAIGVSLVLLAFLYWQVLRLGRRFRAALGNDASDSLASTLSKHLARVEEVDKRLVALASAYKQLATATGLASQKLSVVRFNPFGDTGGDQSFVLAVLDSHDSGYVLTSIHGREGTRVYIKPIDFGKSKYTLSKEEQQALAQASKRVPVEAGI